MRNLWMLPLIVALLALFGCAKSEYWVKGLTLPPGSTVVHKSETTTLDGMPQQIPMLGEPEKALTVAFDNSAGWSAVSSHIDGCMKGQGYQEEMSAIAAMAPGMGVAGNPMDGMRMYTKNGEKYTVMLNDMGAMLKEAGQSQTMKDVPGMGSFMLMVMKMK